jgi:hypothetical protein
MGRMRRRSKGREDQIVQFAAAVIVLAGVANAFQGIAAVAGGGQLAQDLGVPDVGAWGWAFFAYGVVQAFTGVAVLLGSRVAQVAGISLAVLSALSQIFDVADHGAWPVAIIAVDAVIVVALLVCGGAFARERGMVDLFYEENREGYSSVEYVSDPDAARSSAMAATGRPVN